MANTLESGTYAPADKTETVIVWPSIPDEDNPGNTLPDYDNLPDGFIDEQTAANVDYFVLTDGTKRNRPVRDLDGNAITLEPGGAVVTRANGTKYTLAPDELAAYAYAHVKEDDSPAVPVTPPTPAPVDPAPVQPAPMDPTPTPAPIPTPDPAPVAPVTDPTPVAPPEPTPDPAPATDTPAPVVGG